MNRSTIVIAAVLLAAAGAAMYRFAGADGGEPPGGSAVIKKPALDFPPAFPPAPANSEQAAAVPQTAAPNPPPAPPAPLTAPIAKELATARAQAENRPMTQVAKNWFGCATEDGYNATLALIKQKNASSADHFHGENADCAPLATGAHISVMRLDSASGIAQISLDDTHQVYWTDTGALAGDAKKK